MGISSGQSEYRMRGTTYGQELAIKQRWGAIVSQETWESLEFSMWKVVNAGSPNLIKVEIVFLGLQSNQVLLRLDGEGEVEAQYYIMFDPTEGCKIMWLAISYYFCIMHYWLHVKWRLPWLLFVRNEINYEVLETHRSDNSHNFRQAEARKCVFGSMFLIHKYVSLWCLHSITTGCLNNCLIFSSEHTNLNLNWQFPFIQNKATIFQWQLFKV